MAARGRLPPEGRPVQARHGPLPASHWSLEPHPHPGLVEHKLAAQAEEIERLAGDNHRLAATHIALREDLAAAQQEMQKIRAHIRSIQTESDIQMRVLLDKVSKMEVDIRAGESVKKDLQQAHREAQSLLTARQELAAQVQQATWELEKAHADVERLPEMRAELDSLRKEHQRLRATFEYEKGLNTKKVEQLKDMEKDLFCMARELEKLRTEVLNAEKRAHAPNAYGSSYMNPDPLYPPPMHDIGNYGDRYRMPVVHLAAGPAGGRMVPYSSNNPAGVPDDTDSEPVPSAGSGSGWEGAHDASHAQR